MAQRPVPESAFRNHPESLPCNLMIASTLFTISASVSASQLDPLLELNTFTQLVYTSTSFPLRNTRNPMTVALTDHQQFPSPNNSHCPLIPKLSSLIVILVPWSSIHILDFCFEEFPEVLHEILVGSEKLLMLVHKICEFDDLLVIRVLKFLSSSNPKMSKELGVIFITVSTVVCSGTAGESSVAGTAGVVTIVGVLVPSCFVIFDLEPLSLSFDFFEHEHVVMNSTSAGMRHHRLHLYIQRISLIGFPSQSIASSNTNVLDFPCLLVLITEMSQSRQHVDTSLIHIESRKSPTAVLFDDDTGRISIRHCEY
ncbi:hypothetical protein Tco_0017580 [Tanacetum coccineum]